METNAYEFHLSKKTLSNNSLLIGIMEENIFKKFSQKLTIQDFRRKGIYCLGNSRSSLFNLTGNFRSLISEINLFEEDKVNIDEIDNMKIKMSFQK